MKDYFIIVIIIITSDTGKGLWNNYLEERGLGNGWNMRQN